MDAEAATPGATPEEQFHLAGQALCDAIEEALPHWVATSVERVATAWSGELDPERLGEVDAAGERAVAAVMPEMRALLARDPDAQHTTPLELLRRATPFPTDLLRSWGVPPLVRDPSAEQRFGDDAYDLTIAAFSDLGPQVHERGLAWGAGKASVHLARRRADGQR